MLIISGKRLKAIERYGLVQGRITALLETTKALTIDISGNY
jgi:hypothetical protein